MKSTILTTMSLAIIMLIANPLMAQESFKVDAKSSTLAWVGKKVTGKHNGTVAIKSGTVKMNKGKLDGSFEIDMSSITVLDLEGEYKQKLEGHLKSDDFFSVEENPTANFKITKSSDKGNGKYEITGDLTIKGITNSITFPATVKTSNGQLKANAEITIDRTKWKVKYGSGKFFEDLGDKMIYDDIELSLELVAK